MRILQKPLCAARTTTGCPDGRSRYRNGSCCTFHYTRARKESRVTVTISWPTTQSPRPARISSRAGSDTSTMASIWVRARSSIAAHFPGCYPGDRWKRFLSSASVAGGTYG